MSPALPDDALALGARASGARASGDDPAQTSAIAANLARTRAAIAAAALAAGRPQDSVQLIAVSKTHGTEAVTAALAAGQRVFGENRVQEAAQKFPALRDAWPDLELHLIGPLQTNKAADAVRLFDVIQTLDRSRLIDALARAAEAQKRLPRLMIQVNIGDEPQKSGVAWDQAALLIETARRQFGASLIGLMGIAPLGADPSPYFSRLAALGQASGLTALSLGMSGDYPQAIAAGATAVRIGTAIFGHR